VWPVVVVGGGGLTLCMAANRCSLGPDSTCTSV
jgi:hypothetical protein